MIIALVKIWVFTWCIYMSFMFVCNMYLLGIKAYATIVLDKEFNIKIGKEFIYGLPISWAIFYALHFLK